LGDKTSENRELTICQYSHEIQSSLNKVWFKTILKPKNVFVKGRKKLLVHEHMNK